MTNNNWLRLILPSIAFVLIYGVFFVYPPLRLAWLLQPDWQPDTLSLLLIMTGPALARLSYERLPNNFTRWCAAIGFTWAGLCFITLLLLLPVELVNFLWPVADIDSGRYILAGTMALGFLGIANALTLEVRALNLTLPADAPSAAQGLQFAQISDVHIGSRSPDLLQRVVGKVNALGVDRVFITGDLIDFANISQQQLAPLAQLQAPTDFCIGNHERYVDLEDICQRLRAVGINVLRNESSDHAPLQIVGIDDAERRDQIHQEIHKLPPIPDRYRVLLYHRPDGAEAASAWGAHLMLCGHTHNGQIVPFNFLVRRVFPRIRGRYNIGPMVLYVSPGTGTWGPVLRLGSRGEITHITIT